MDFGSRVGVEIEMEEQMWRRKGGFFDEREKEAELSGGLWLWR